MKKPESGTGSRISRDFIKFKVKYIKTIESNLVNGNFLKQLGLIHKYKVAFHGDEGDFTIAVFKKDDVEVIGQSTLLSLDSFDRGIYLSNDSTLENLAFKVIKKYPPVECDGDGSGQNNMESSL